ncbi:MAG: hypothetical protein R3316_06875 [Rhodovibrionaceae bacterium]|nr:hypothetical protein [Rhodovibrionaceae bacterium]
MSTNNLPGEIIDFIGAELDAPVHPAAKAMADKIAEQHAEAALGVLFYGSCLRNDSVLEGRAEGVLDFYLVVDSYERTYDSTFRRVANRLLPPNVFYYEQDWQDIRLRAKYAVISLAQFEAGTSRRTFNSSLWARFAQPSRLLAVRDPEAGRRIRCAVARAPVTLLQETAPLMAGELVAEDIWCRAFEETYRSELRSERAERARELVEKDRERYRRLTPLALAGAGLPVEGTEHGFTMPGVRPRAVVRWRLRRVQGKSISVLRLVKGAFTFEGGLDYLMWKIERHSGVSVPVSEWQRRHPLLSAPGLAWRLHRRGAFR